MRRRERQLDSITDSMDMNWGKFMFIALGVLQFMRWQRVRQGLVTQQQQHKQFLTKSANISSILNLDHELCKVAEIEK